MLNAADGTITRIDTASVTVTGTLLVGQYLGGVEVDGGTVYVAAEVGRARFAFGRLWLTVPAQNTVVTFAPTGW